MEAAPLPEDLPPTDRWRLAVEGWLVPDAVRAAAPDPQPTLDPAAFRWRPDEDAAQPVRPSRRRALEALPEGGSVLDIGVGGGASSLGLVPHARHITGVDALPGMLASFEASARDAGVGARSVLGSWPEVADQVEPVDVVVCHHALYGVAEIEPFLVALTAAARRRVVVEVSARPPMIGLNPLWQAFHGIERTDRRVADDLQAVLGSLGLESEREDLVLHRPAPEVTPDLVASLRRRLCVGPERDPEIAEFLESQPAEEHGVVALWWPGGAVKT